MMHDNLVDFEASVNAKMLLQGQNPQIWRNDQPVRYVNAAEDKDHLANCVVFLSAVEQQKLHEFQGVKLNVTMKANISRVVAVSLRSLDLSGIVIPPDGKAVKVSTDYTTEDVKRVTRAILVNFPKS
ncbi:hypothetical protein OESDEN_09399 [Oesophagostomum dentatum]|uniref:Uncharacterized protein n=1 Tax=Oesophagostomum dentatum TaxID=61180 RepID=A0A0B1T4N4_OESDE|nr:hypothetical protein OESDEN_09399 [Oesophagostomum dentatum]